MLPCSALQPAELALNTLLPSAPRAPLTQILLTGLPYKGEGAILPLLRNVQNPLTHGVGAGEDEEEKQHHFQPEEEANTLCLSQRCPKVFSSALPRAEVTIRGTKQLRLGMDTASLGPPRRCKVVQGELSLLWAKPMGNTERTLKASLNVQFSETRGWSDSG